MEKIKSQFKEDRELEQRIKNSIITQISIYDKKSNILISVIDNPTMRTQGAFIMGIINGANIFINKKDVLSFEYDSFNTAYKIYLKNVYYVLMVG